LAVHSPTADDSALLIATEWIRIGAVVDRRGRIVVGMALGIAYLHSQSVLHRDLKSTNVLIDHAMHSRVCDFGHSKVWGWNQTQTAHRGISLYNDPEMSTGGGRLRVDLLNV
jgi:serine/threonine protein kinase